MTHIIALTAFLTIIQGDQSVTYQTEDRFCDGLLRTLSERMSDADMACIATSPRPIARPDDLRIPVQVEGAS